jgi:hypothetical protein
MIKIWNWHTRLPSYIHDLLRRQAQLVLNLVVKIKLFCLKPTPFATPSLRTILSRAFPQKHFSMSGIIIIFELVIPKYQAALHRP